MIRVDAKKLKPYGDRLNDGSIQLSFTFPLRASPELKEAARLYAERLGLEKVSVATMEEVGEGFTFFVVYGCARETINLSKIRVHKLEFEHMHYFDLVKFMDEHVQRPIVVVGGATGSDAHTVGIDAILNMKGFAGDYGLERYAKFKVHNLRAQLTNDDLLNKAAELKADAILVSQVVTQRDAHIDNLKLLKTAIDKNKQNLVPHVITAIGGPRIGHELAVKLGFDAGFGPGTLPSQVASFIVKEFLHRNGVKVEMKPPAKVHADKKHEKSPYDEPPPKFGAAHEPSKPHAARSCRCKKDDKSAN